MKKRLATVRTILAFSAVLAIAGCGSQTATGSAGPTTSAAADNAAVDAPPTISESDAQAARSRLQGLSIACKLLTPADIQPLGVPYKSGNVGEDCNNGHPDGTTHAARLAISVMSARQFSGTFTNETGGNPKTSTVNGATVLSNSIPGGCASGAQRNDGSVVIMSLTQSTNAAVDCQTVSQLTVRALGRIPANF